MARSFKKITKKDLMHLAAIAKKDREDLFCRRELTGRLYKNKLFAVALCQGAALHYLYGTNGIKDFDVWSFYEEHPGRPFPYRKVGKLDFGNEKFRKTEDSPQFKGRRVDLIGRSIKNINRGSPVDVLRDYLREGSKKRVKSVKCLVQKPVILIEPKELLGTIVWPENPIANR